MQLIESNAKTFKTLIYSFILIFLLSGCAAMSPVDESYKREFIYDYSIAGKSKLEIWKLARNNFAINYGNSTKVFQVMDESEGIILGKGVVSWDIASGMNAICDYNYNIKFAAYDGQAKLKLTLSGITDKSRCGWDRPSGYGYDQIVLHFNEINEQLALALKGADNF